MANPFTETRKMFIDVVEYTQPLDFDHWIQIPDDLKAAALFVHFYETITLAWFKADSLRRGSAEDGVSTVLQYLQKNVAIIANSPNKFDPKYIYRVAYNCLYCICHDIKRDQERFAYERTNLTVSRQGSEVDLCDLVPDHDEDFCTTADRAEIWAIVSDLGDDAELVVSKLIGEGVPGRRMAAARKTEIINELRTRLAPFQAANFN